MSNLVENINTEQKDHEFLMRKNNEYKRKRNLTPPRIRKKYSEPFTCGQILFGMTIVVVSMKIYEYLYIL